jgi:hypothetical protein
MKPLNSAERTNAFLRFLLLFLITVGLIVTVVFFSVQVPWKENDQMRKQVLLLQDEKRLSESFAKDVRETQLALEKYADPITSSAITQERVNNQLNTLRSKMRQMPSGESALYELVVVSLSDLNDAKKKLRDAQPN